MTAAERLLIKSALDKKADLEQDGNERRLRLLAAGLILLIEEQMRLYDAARGIKNTATKDYRQQAYHLYQTKINEIERNLPHPW